MGKVRRHDARTRHQATSAGGAKINPNADRGASLGPECPREESNFAQPWVNLHWAKIASTPKITARHSVTCKNVMQSYTIMQAPDRMKSYPDELRK